MNISPFARIYLAIMERIQSKVPEIKYISRDLGQLEGYSHRPAVDFPCLLVSFRNWQFENWGDNVQAGQGTVVVKIGFAQHLDSSNLTEPEWRGQSLDYWEIEYRVNQALHGWTPGEMEGYLTRTGTDTANLPMGVTAVILPYSLAFDDYSTEEPDIIGQRPGVIISS